MRYHLPLSLSSMCILFRLLDRYHLLRCFRWHLFHISLYSYICLMYLVLLLLLLLIEMLRSFRYNLHSQLASCYKIPVHMFLLWNSFDIFQANLFHYTFRSTFVHIAFLMLMHLFFVDRSMLTNMDLLSLKLHLSMILTVLILRSIGLWL